MNSPNFGLKLKERSTLKTELFCQVYLKKWNCFVNFIMKIQSENDNFEMRNKSTKKKRKKERKKTTRNDFFEMKRLLKCFCFTQKDCFQSYEKNYFLCEFIIPIIKYTKLE
jgi:hypothetical protein